MYNVHTQPKLVVSVREKIVTKRSSIVIVYEKTLNLRYNPTYFDDANNFFKN